MRLFRGRCLQRASPPPLTHLWGVGGGAVHVSADAQFLQARNIRWHAVSDDAQCRMAYLTRRYAGDLALAAELKPLLNDIDGFIAIERFQSLMLTNY